MQNIQISKSIKAKMYDANDLIFDNKNVTDNLLSVLKKEPNSQDNFLLSGVQEYIANISSSIYLDNLKVKVFVLQMLNTPASFAIFEETSQSAYQIKYVWTSVEFAKIGLASILMRASVANLIDAGAKKIAVSFEKDNLIAFDLFESFAKIEGIKTQKSQKGQLQFFEFDVTGVDAKQLLQDVCQMAI